MGMKPRKKPDLVQSFVMDAVSLANTTIQVGLARPPGSLPVTGLRIVGGSIKRIGSKAQGGLKQLTINVVYSDAT